MFILELDSSKRLEREVNGLPSWRS